jgi:hypothetical protein
MNHIAYFSMSFSLNFVFDQDFLIQILCIFFFSLFYFFFRFDIFGKKEEGEEEEEGKKKMMRRTFNLFAALWLDKTDYRKRMTTTTMLAKSLAITKEMNEQII